MVGAMNLRVTIFVRFISTETTWNAATVIPSETIIPSETLITNEGFICFHDRSLFVPSLTADAMYRTGIFDDAHEITSNLETPITPPVVSKDDVHGTLENISRDKVSVSSSKIDASQPALDPVDTTPAGKFLYFHEEDQPKGRVPSHVQVSSACTTKSIVPVIAKSTGLARLPPGRPPGRSKPPVPLGANLAGGAARPMRKSKMAAADHILALTLQQHSSRRDVGASLQTLSHEMLCILLKGAVFPTRRGQPRS
jgi:hypothetical protein